MIHTLIGFVLFLYSSFQVIVTTGFSTGGRANALSPPLHTIASSLKHHHVTHPPCFTLVRRTLYYYDNQKGASGSSLQATPKFTMPSQEECVELGIREWPQQTKSSLSWKEEVKEETTLVRYILQGTGTVRTDDGTFSRKFYAGTLVEVQGPEILIWERNQGEDVIILTPGFENGALFATAIVGFVTMVGALLALS